MGAPYSVALLATLVISIGIGVVVGFISLRIEGIYLAIMTLALAEVIRNALMALKSTIKIDITNVYLFGVNVNENAVYLLITFTFIPVSYTHLDVYKRQSSYSCQSSSAALSVYFSASGTKCSLTDGQTEAATSSGE